MSKIMTEQRSTPENRDKMSKQMSISSLKMWQNSEFRERKSQQTSRQLIERWADPAYRIQQLKEISDFWKNPEAKEAQSKRCINQWKKPEYREKQSKIAIELWQDPEYRAKVLKANSKSPNKPETILNQLTPPEVRYTGDWSFWVRIKLLVNGEYVTKSKNPDFKITGQKKVIELYGNYWHKNDNPDDLINAYKEIGYDCLVIWESEIYNELELTLDRIAQFINKPQWQMTLL
jgi:G:T-mismatch repair DNA endonuclease (very short patch repair protein)